MPTIKSNNQNNSNVCKTAVMFIAIATYALLVHVCSPTPKTFGPEKPFTVDKGNVTFRAFRPVTISAVDSREHNHYFYVQDADNNAPILERRIIVRRIEDGRFFAAKLKNQDLKLQRGQRIKLTLVQYWRSETVLDEQLIADLETSQ